MNNGDTPATPVEFDHIRDMNDDVEIYTGLTKREQFAAMAMQGFCADCADCDMSDMARSSVIMADALLKELAKCK